MQACRVWLQGGPGGSCKVLRWPEADLGYVQGPLCHAAHRDNAHHMTRALRGATGSPLALRSGERWCTHTELHKL